MVCCVIMNFCALAVKCKKNKNKNLDICIAEEIMADLNANANANGFNGKVNVKENVGAGRREERRYEDITVTAIWKTLRYS